MRLHHGILLTDHQVNNIASQTTEQQVRDFFSFCGKITNLVVKPTSNEADATKAATVTFEKETAAKTALLLDNTQLGPTQVSVTSGASLGELSGQSGSASTGDASAHQDPDSVDQEDKPRSRIAAEYLAHGYTLSDQALQRAIELDQQHGISARFTNALRTYDDKYKVTNKAQAIDHQYGITSRGYQLFAGLHTYYQKAANTPTGQRLVDFYNQGQKQVVDIHTEARRLADLKSGKDPKTAGPHGVSNEEATEANKKSQTTVPGTDKTVCQCGGNDGTCPCEAGKCACSGCGKAGVEGEHTATGKADVVSATSGVQPLPEKTV